MINEANIIQISNDSVKSGQRVIKIGNRMIPVGLGGATPARGSDTTTDTPALAEDVRLGKEFFVNGQSFSGTMPDAEVERIRESGSTGERLKITPGYLAEEINETIGGGVDISDATATAADLLKGKTAYGYIPDEFRYGKIEGTLDVSNPAPTTGFMVTRIDNYEPATPELNNVITEIFIEGIGFVGYEDEEDPSYKEGFDFTGSGNDDSGMNGKYVIMAGYEYNQPNDRIYYRTGTYIDYYESSEGIRKNATFILKRYIDEWDEWGGDGWQLCFYHDGESIEDARTAFSIGGLDLPTNSDDESVEWWYVDIMEGGEQEITVSLPTTVDYPQKDMTLTGTIASGYSLTNQLWTWSGSQSFSSFETTPKKYCIYATTDSGLIGNPIAYDFYEAIVNPPTGSGVGFKVYNGSDVIGPIPASTGYSTFVSNGMVYREESFSYNRSARPEGVNDETFLYIPIADRGLSNTYTVLWSVSGPCGNNSGPYIAICNTMNISDTRVDINSGYIGLEPWGGDNETGFSDQCVRVKDGQIIDRYYSNAENGVSATGGAGIFLVAKNGDVNSPKYIAIRDMFDGKATYGSVAVFNWCLSDSEVGDFRRVMRYFQRFVSIDSEEWNNYYWAVDISVNRASDDIANSVEYFRNISVEADGGDPTGPVSSSQGIAFNGGFLKLSNAGDALDWGTGNFQISLDITPTSDARQCICAWEKDQVFAICFSYSSDRRIGVFWDGSWSCHQLSESLELNQTYHVDIYRKDGILHCLIDGVDTGKTYDLTDVYVSPKDMRQNFYFGRWGGDPGDFSARWQGRMNYIQVSDSIKAANVPK